MAQINQNDPGKDNTQDSWAWAWLDSLNLIEDIKPAQLVPSTEERALEDKGDCRVLQEMVSVSMDQTLRLEPDAAGTSSWGKDSQKPESFQKPKMTVSEGNDVILEERICVTSTGHRFGYKIMERVTRRDLFNTSTFLYWIPDYNTPQFAELANPTGSEELSLNGNNSYAQQLVKFDPFYPVNFKTEESEIVQRPSSPLQIQVEEDQELPDVSEPRNRKEQQSDVSATTTVESHKIKDNNPVIDPSKYQVDARAYIEMATPRLRGGGPVLQEKREINGFERARRGNRKWKPKYAPVSYPDSKCRHCGLEFRQHSMLKRHFKIHEGNATELHCCSVCQAPYKCSTTLVKHMNQAHSSRHH